MGRNVTIDYIAPPALTVNPGGSSLLTLQSGAPSIDTGVFPALDIGWWHPGADAWQVRDGNGNAYNNPIGGQTAFVTDGSLNQPVSPQTVTADPSGYYSHVHTDNTTRWAAWQMSQVDHKEMYALWRFRIVGFAVNVNQKTFRIYGKGSIGIPQNSGQNYEGFYFDNFAGSLGIGMSPGPGAVSPSQILMLGLWQTTVGTNGGWATSGGINYATDLVDDGYHNLLTHWQLDGGPGGVGRTRYWWDGLAMTQPDGLPCYNRSGFLFGLAQGGAEWNDGPASDGPFGTNVPSWLRYNMAYPTPVGFGSIRWWDTQHAGQNLPGSVDTEGVWLSTQPIDPNRTTF